MDSTFSADLRMNIKVYLKVDSEQKKPKQQKRNERWWNSDTNCSQ